jgi:hypothetical protein
MDVERQASQPRQHLARHPSSLAPMVEGANLWLHFNVRCPGCNKLFRIDSKEISSSNPHFQCSVCTTQFCFDFPPTNLAKIETRVVQRARVEDVQPEVVEKFPDNLKNCPKCDTPNPAKNVECAKCGVILEKADQPFPGLSRAWSQLLADYENVQKHLSFVDQCEDLQALPYALKKYEALRQTQPHDPLGKKMAMEVMLRSLKRNPQSRKALETIQTFSKQINWVRVRRLAPLVAGSFFILMGLTNPDQRNLIGIGTSLIFLTVGFKIFLKGRIDLRDFY